jgi:hypothetical protein
MKIYFFINFFSVFELFRYIDIKNNFLKKYYFYIILNENTFKTTDNIILKTPRNIN